MATPQGFWVTTSSFDFKFQENYFECVNLFLGTTYVFVQYEFFLTFYYSYPVIHNKF